MTIVHMTCCDDRETLCGFLDDVRLPGDYLLEGEEWCLACLRLDNRNTPCGNPLCRLRTIRDRFTYALRQGRPLLAVRQLWRLRIR